MTGLGRNPAPASTHLRRTELPSGRFGLGTGHRAQPEATVLAMASRVLPARCMPYTTPRVQDERRPQEATALAALRSSFKDNTGMAKWSCKLTTRGALHVCRDGALCCALGSPHNLVG